MGNNDEIYEYGCNHKLSALEEDSSSSLFSLSAGKEDGAERVSEPQEGRITPIFGVKRHHSRKREQSLGGRTEEYFSLPSRRLWGPFSESACLLLVSAERYAGTRWSSWRILQLLGPHRRWQCVSLSLFVPQIAHWGEQEKGAASRAGPGVPQWGHCSCLGGSQPWHHASC